MMKKQNGIVLAGLLAASLGCQTSSVKAHNNGFLGACAVAAGIVGAALGVAAIVDWCSETDDQLINRLNAQIHDSASRYQDTMTYFGQISGMNAYVSVTHKPFNMISETVLHEFATYIWHKNSTQADYRAGVWSTKKILDSAMQELRKRIRNLENKRLQYEDQQRLLAMRQLLSNVEELLSNITLFAEALEYHKAYFNVYDTIDTVRNRYLQEITILESGRYSMETEIKRYILGRNNSQYAFRSFVIDINADIEKVESKIRALGYHYEAKRQYAEGLVNYLVAIKNIVVVDPRYQQELYEWEQARLQRLHVEALKMQAQAELERVQILRDQNRIIEENNRLKRAQLYQQQQNVVDNVDITVTMRL